MNLRKHPDIFLNEGEVHYFDHKGPNADLTLAQYQMKFIKSDQYREGQLVGDCTPAYMTSPNAIYDIQAAFPTAKLLFVLRNPVDRLFSFYHMTMANGKAKNTFEDLIDSDLARSGTFYPNSGPVRRGIYVEHLERISSIFSREQMHFICSEEVKKNLNYNQTFNFLGVRPMQVDSETARENSYPEDVMLAATRDMLNDYYSHWNELLRRWMLLGSPAHQSFVACIDGWSKAKETNQTKSKKKINEQKEQKK